MISHDFVYIRTPAFVCGLVYVSGDIFVYVLNVQKHV